MKKLSNLLLVVLIFVISISCSAFANEESQTADGRTVTLVSSSVSGSKVTATFRIENNSGKSISMSSLLDWSAKDASGKKLDLDWQCADLNGTLLNDDLIKGDICFTGVTQQPVKIYYETGFFGGKTLVFTVGAGNQTKNTNDKQKDGITQSADGRDVTLLDAKISGNKITATFKITNTGKKDISLSTLLDWSAKDGSGQKLDLDWQCADFNGTLLPDDFIKGDICFTGVTEMPVKIYYETSFWGGETLVFTVK